MRAFLSIEEFINTKLFIILRTKEGLMLKFGILIWYYIRKIVIGKNENLYQKLISIICLKLVNSPDDSYGFK